MLSTNGGPASPTADGWVNYAIPVIAGLMYRDSVEVDELKHPIRVERLGIVTDSAGAGRRRGAPAQEIIYTPRENPVTVVIPCDGQFEPPHGVNGGHNGTPGGTWLIGHNGDETKLPNLVNRPWQKGEALRGRDSSGGGYGDPLTREPERVRLDVIEGWESLEKARDVYGVIFTGRIEDDSLAVDPKATEQRRAAVPNKNQSRA
jgi:N-methylhydantoinase B